MGTGIEHGQDIEALATTAGLNKDPHKAPQITEKGLQNKVRRIQEEEMAFSGLGFFQQGR